MRLRTAKQMKQIDAFTIETEPVSSLALMERAALEFTRQFTARWTTDRPIVVFAGNGNNGGDALAISRLLAERGYSVEAFLFNTGGRLSADCAAMMQQLDDTDGDFHEITNQFTPPTLTDRHIVVDGLFGTGLSRSLSGGYAAVVRYINASPSLIVSIDIPSGLFAEDNIGNDTSHIVHAHHTFTFHAYKPAFVFDDYARFAGEITVLDILLREPADIDLDAHYHVLSAGQLARMLKPRSRFAHKGEMGHALLLAGREGMAGAAVLSAKSALRSGVGKLTVVSAQANRTILQTAVPEALFLSLEEVANNGLPLESYSAIAIGPGLRTDQESTDLLQYILSQLRFLSIPLLLDADAINILSAHPELLSDLPTGSILTPHRGEMQRLLRERPDSFDLLQQTVQLAEEMGVNVVLKGAFTKIVSIEGNVAVNTTGNAGMATAGSGDVLTGIILGLLTRSLSPLQAAHAGVYLHGLAGDLAATRLGQESLIASDIIEHLPAAFLQLSQPS